MRNCRIFVEVSFYGAMINACVFEDVCVIVLDSIAYRTPPTEEGNAAITHSTRWRYHQPNGRRQVLCVFNDSSVNLEHPFVEIFTSGQGHSH
jgi:hypothetical protein